MYFGHGGAQVCFSRRRVEELIDFRVSGLLDQSESDTKSPCNASVLLMGCSSGRLVSINRKNSDSIEQTPLYYEPEGVALSYLCAGAPCVVGNLWDVTDNDIDR
jgi:separase